MMTRLSILLSYAFAAVTLPAVAQDNQLYEDPADPNASFVRVVSPGETLAVIGDNTFDAVQGGVTPYVMVMAGPVSVAVGDLTSEGDIPATSFYTFVRGTDGDLHMLQDDITNSPAQADLVFYNLSDLPSVDLYVPSVETVAIEDITQNTSRQVTLKAPLTLDFEVRDDDATLASLTAIEMRRRAGVTVVFSGSDGTYSAYSTENLYAN